MKIAIIGSGPNAILSALHFHQLGAAVVLFQRSPLGGNLRFLLEHTPDLEVSFRHKKFTIKKFWEEVLVPSIKIIEENNLSRAGNILRVHKRFLDKKETIENKSRVHDLFRVIFSISPKESILKQVGENPEVFKLLGENVLNSLHSPVESFEDFDIVIDARGRGCAPLMMGAGSAPALNELSIKDSAAIFYEKDVFTHEVQNEKHVLVVGEGKSLVLALMKLQAWLYTNKENYLTVVTHKSLTTLVSENDIWFRSKLQEIIDHSIGTFEKDKFEFEKKLFEWRSLEDYVKVKIPEPQEPRAKIKFFTGYDVTSVDRLLDRDGLFVTIESPDFRTHQDFKNDLKTIPCDAIYVCKGHEKDEVFKLNENEDGVYVLYNDDLSQTDSAIEKIEASIMTFFSRA